MDAFSEHLTGADEVVHLQRETATLDFGSGSPGSVMWRHHTSLGRFAGEYWVDGSYIGMTGIDSLFFFGRQEWSLASDTRFDNASLTDSTLELAMVPLELVAELVE